MSYEKLAVTAVKALRLVTALKQFGYEAELTFDATLRVKLPGYRGDEGVFIQEVDVSVGSECTESDCEMFLSYIEDAHRHFFDKRQKQQRLEMVVATLSDQQRQIIAEATADELNRALRTAHGDAPMNILPLLELTDEELEKLNTRHLLAAHRRSRGSFYVCSCGPGYHCGDDVLPLDEQVTNQKVREFRVRLKLILDAREHVPTSAQAKARTVRRDGRPEKKQMRY